MEYFNHVVVLSGLAVVAIQQILKLKFIPVAFANRYPVPTLILLSSAASAIAVWQDKVATPQGWTNWVKLIVTVVLTAAITYNQTLRNWGQLRATEGEGK